MTEIALSIGAGLIAFGPLIALFTTLVYSKAQLVIVVTSSAFFFLLSTVVASMFWWVFHHVGLLGPMSGIIPGVLAQFAFRCAFVAIYHRVEKAIQDSLSMQEIEDSQHQRGSQILSRPSTEHDPNPGNDWTAVAKLRLQLNDAACGIAGGVGFGGMHAILLYGTLLASEIKDNSGVLYQDSCPAMPSLAVSAIYALFFSILDIFWMLLTFFGMRRRRMYHRGEGPPQSLREYDGRAGAYLGNTRGGGNMALLSVLITHFLASSFTTADYFKFGCMVSIPATGCMVLFVAFWFYAGVGRIYMPPREEDMLSEDARHIE